MRRRTGGLGLLGALMAAALAGIATATLASLLATGGRALVRTDAVRAAEDALEFALESTAFDARRAGWDPAGLGIAPLAMAAADRLTFVADDDGDGHIDPASDEVVSLVCAPGKRRLSRIVGAQSMPLAGGVVGCRFRYVDGAGTELGAGTGGLAAELRPTVAAVVLELTIAPAGGGPPLTRAGRTVLGPSR